MPPSSNLRSDSSEDPKGRMPGNILSSQYAHSELLELARELRALGYDKVLDIPQIAVIGKQSAGKSSLVEAVAGINVPRDAGTCTRCPMECSLFKSSEVENWSCLISLREHGINAPFSPEIVNKDEVELWIRRAQAAVLCPHQDRDSFKNMPRKQIKQATDHTRNPEVKKFSNTVVEVKILDPEGTDIVFVDLPGLIPNADDDIVSQVEAMVRQYISLPSTIILVTVPAEDDLENQKAMKLAKDVDPDGERTIGVVTKADKIDPGETNRQKLWRDIFEGHTREHNLYLGYYAIHLPNDEERKRKNPPAEVRKNAELVFNTVAPWKDIKALPSQTRLGVDALLRDLSPLLLQRLNAAIPKMKTAVDRLLVACLNDLAGLSKKPQMDSAQRARLISGFCEAVKQTLDGTSDDKSFVQSSREHYHTFARSIRSTAPDFRPFKDPSKYVMPPEPLSDSRKQENDSSHPGPGDTHGCTQSLPFNRNAVLGLLDVRQIIKESTGWELPHSVPYSAKTRLIQDFVQHWTELSNRCFKDIQRLVEHHVYKVLVPQHLDEFPLVKEFVMMQLLKNMDYNLKAWQAAVQQVLEREEPPYFTQNSDYFEDTRKIWLRHYQEVLVLCDSKYCIEEGTTCTRLEDVSEGESHPVARAVTAIRALPGYSDVSEMDLPKLLPADDFIDEITVMADVRSYFQVSYKRVIDTVPQTIRTDFVKGFADGLHAYLLGELSLEGETMLHPLFEKDLDVSQKRKDLEEMQRQLKNMMVKLNGLKI